jgi:hypothetical protein
MNSARCLSVRNRNTVIYLKQPNLHLLSTLTSADGEQCNTAQASYACSVKRHLSQRVSTAGGRKQQICKASLPSVSTAANTLREPENRKNGGEWHKGCYLLCFRRRLWERGWSNTAPRFPVFVPSPQKTRSLVQVQSSSTALKNTNVFWFLFTALKTTPK